MIGTVGEARGGMPSSSSGQNPAGTEVRQTGNGDDEGPGRVGRCGHGQDSGSSCGDSGAVVDGDACERDCVVEGKKPAILVLAPRFVVKFAVCKHTSTNDIFVAVSYIMDIHSSRVVLLCKGERIIWNLGAQEAAANGWSWVATTAPLTGSPAAYKLRMTSPVNMPLQDLECSRCRGQLASENEEEDLDDEQLREWLERKSIPTPDEETEKMSSEEGDTKQARLLQGKQYQDITWR